MFSDLISRSLDAEFDDLFSTEGSFHKSTSKGREYWYYVSAMVKAIGRGKCLGLPTMQPSTNESEDSKS
jgi:hypothetical protein